MGENLNDESNDFGGFHFRNAEQSGSVSRLVKLKGAIRGAIDGSSLEATEVPTVWDALTDEPQVEAPFLKSRSRLSSKSSIFTTFAQFFSTFLI